MYGGVPGHEEDVVEGKTELGPEDAHLHPVAQPVPTPLCATAHRRQLTADGGPELNRSISKTSGQLR
jgi:hypothetical protein